jgi:hypothetical protein
MSDRLSQIAFWASDPSRLAAAYQRAFEDPGASSLHTEIQDAAYAALA